jgi:hypothetical protein
MAATQAAISALELPTIAQGFVHHGILVLPPGHKSPETNASTGK